MMMRKTISLIFADAEKLSEEARALIEAAFKSKLKSNLRIKTEDLRQRNAELPTFDGSSAQAGYSSKQQISVAAAAWTEPLVIFKTFGWMR